MRPLPYAKEAEQFAIGCCIYDPRCRAQCVEYGMTPEWFYDMRNAFWYEQMLLLETPDLPALYEKTKSHELFEKCGGLAHLQFCESYAEGLTLNLLYHLEIIREKFLARKIISTCQGIAIKAYEHQGNVEPLLSDAEREILSIRPQTNGTFKSIKELVPEAIIKIEAMMTRQSITGLPTGLVDLDQMTDGLHPGDLIVIGAFPGFGKSTIASNIIFNNALKGTPSVFFTAEMEPVRIVMRALASEAKVNIKSAVSGDVLKFTVPVNKISNCPVYIDTITGNSIEQIRAKARRFKQKYDVKLAAFDYIQLITGRDSDTREQEVSNIAMNLKQIAMELRIPVIAPSQLNDDGRLRESRAIGQHADGVWLLQPEDEEETPENNASCRVNLKIKKNREGETGTVDLVFLKSITRFESASKIHRNDIP